MSGLEFRFTRAERPLTDAWQRVPVAPRGNTPLGISFRPLQAAAFGLDVRTTLRTLLAYPFQIIRLGAYWNQIEPEPGAFRPDELDWQIEAAEAAGKKIIVCVGAVKTFGYPEVFVPAHHLKQPFQEHTRIQPAGYPALLEAAEAHITRLVERYRGHESIVAWQLEHEAADPLGVEHSWRLDADFVKREVDALRLADSVRPVMMNGFLPTTLPVRLSQWWSTRDRGNSLDVAQRLADIVGIDYYPRNALFSLGGKTLYLDGSHSLTQEHRRRQLLAWAQAGDRKLMVSEGQAEPWETATTPPNPPRRGMYSCLPETIIENYNSCMGWHGGQARLYAYLFWGAEYWVLRKRDGDASYLQAFVRILERSKDQQP